MALMTVKMEISYSEIAQVLGKAAELIFNHKLHWAKSFSFVMSDTDQADSTSAWYASKQFYENPFKFRVTYYDQYGEEASTTITNARLQAGVELLALQYPSSFMDILRGSRDPEDADNLLQCIVLGGIVFED
jgi:hypothetical protein